MAQRAQTDLERGINIASIARRSDTSAVHPEQRLDMLPSGPALFAGSSPNTASPASAMMGGAYQTNVDVSSHLDPGEPSSASVGQPQHGHAVQSGSISGHVSDRAPRDTATTSSYDCPSMI